MPERTNRLADAIKSLRKRFGGEKQTGPETITLRQAQILSVGMKLQSDGFDWWTGWQMIKSLEEEGYKGHPLFSDLAQLQVAGLIRARWVKEEKRTEKYHQVTNEGRRAKSKVYIPNPDTGEPELVPQTEQA